MAFNSLLLGNTSRATNSGANLMLSGGHCYLAKHASDTCCCDQMRNQVVLPVDHFLDIEHKNMH
jgi:hypothetical protein